MSSSQVLQESLNTKEHKGKKFFGYWWYSLKFARGQRKMEPNFWQSLKVRFSAFGPLADPVFILGCPRSGTTYLGELLENLPEVSYYFEPPILKYLSRHVYQGSIASRKLGFFYRLFFRTLLLFAPGVGKQIIEKNPNHTLIAHKLLQVFPKAKFVIISRNGLDVTLSLVKKPWHLEKSRHSGKREPGGYLYGPYAHFYIEDNRQAEYESTTDVHRCIWIWKRHAQEIEQLLQTLPKQSFYHFDYEDLIRKREQVIPELLSFLGITNSESLNKVMVASEKGTATSIGSGKAAFDARELDKIYAEAGGLLNGH